ncbi:MAG TPA: hypothetical protein VJY62_01035 [Bacteroidia bacterium]|nr:hypothetical protein [Bacteroidia bacterium]
MKDAKAFYTATFVLPLLLFTSCATIFNTPKTGFRIRADKNIKIVSVEKNLKHSLNYGVVRRGPGEVKIHIEADSNMSMVSMPAQKSNVYWLNVLNLGAGFFIDKKSDKRFAHPKRIFIERTDTSFIAVRYPTLKKGTIEFTFTFPYVGTCLIKTTDGYYSSPGLHGIGMGLAYCFKNKNYITLNAGTADDSRIHFDGPYYKFANDTIYQECKISFVSFRYHKRFERIDIGCGFNFSNSHWSLEHIIRTDSSYFNDRTENKVNSSLGLSLNLKYHFFKMFSLGILYQPGFAEFNSSPVLNYQNFISFEAAINLKIIRLGKRAELTRQKQRMMH